MINRQEAAEIVVYAGNRLVDEGLIARTWGNVSCRIDSNTFMITPSGRAYNSLAAEDIVVVNINDLSYEGSVEPSSEKKVHAAAYRQRKDVNFIIHTHQLNASSLSPLAIDLDVDGPEIRKQIGEKIWSVPYALPGSTALMKNVETVLAQCEGKAYLMTSHGALCLGSDCDDSFNTAMKLEEECCRKLLNQYYTLSGSNFYDPVEFGQFYAARFSGKKPKAGYPGNSLLGSSIKEGDKIYFYPGGIVGAGGGAGQDKCSNMLVLGADNEKIECTDHVIQASVVIHRKIYAKYSGIRAIIHSVKPDIINYSLTGKTLYPMVDDFAQIIGVNARSVESDYSHAEKTARKITSRLSGRSALLLGKNGALCCGPNIEDALAAEMILEKNCRAAIAVDLFGRGKPLKGFEALLMRYVYLQRYAKKAEK
jgi:L-fuculose-phosphate aldolase